MPELPEVETIKLGLEKKIVGLTIKDIQVLSPKSFFGNPKDIEGAKITRLWRRGKVLGIEMDSFVVLIHLKMSGQLILSKKELRFVGGHPTEDMMGKMPNIHTRVVFRFNDGSSLFFNDQRKFGWIKIIENLKLKTENLLKRMGPEPLEKDFTWQVLKENLLKHKKTPIKVAILDQSVVAGVGNIYASEACFNAKLDPRLKVSELSNEQFESLHRGVLQALRDGIRRGGSSRAHFVDSEGKKGYFLDYAYVYWKDGTPCKVCGSTIRKITQGGRGTYFCPNCQ